MILSFAYWQRMIRALGPVERSPNTDIHATTRYLFVEFTPSHEALFDTYGKLNESQLVSLNVTNWWIKNRHLDRIFRSAHPNLQLVFFLTLDRLLYGSDPSNFLRFAEKTDLPLTGILHRLPSNKSERRSFGQTKGALKSIVVLSKPMCEHVSQLARDPVQVHYLPHNPLTSSSFHTKPDSIRASIGASKADFVVSILGEARKEKGIDLLLRSLERLSVSVREKLFLVFAGKAKDWEEEKIRHEFLRHGCRGYVDLRESTERRTYRVIPEQDFVNYVCASDLGLLMSRGEQRWCASGVLPNYVWARKPVLAAKDSLIGAETAENDLGTVVDFDDPRQLSQTLSEWVSNPSRWAPTRNFEKFRSSISPQAVVERLQEIVSRQV